MGLKRMPVLKEKKRYLMFSITSENKIPYFELKGAISNSIMNLIGEKSAGKSNYRLIKNLWDEKNNEGVISCSVRYVDDIKVALALIQQIGDIRVIFRVTKVSGTIKALRKEAV